MYDKHQMQYYPDDEPMSFVIAYDYSGIPIYSDEDDCYIAYGNELVRYEDSSSDRFLLQMGGKLKKVSDLIEHL